MKTKGNTTWKPAPHRRPMLTNRLAGPQLGVVAPLIASAARWLLPWLAVSGGVALTSLVTKNALPDVPINRKNIGLASALMGGGATAYFVSEGLSEPYKPWAYAAAVAGVASGLYFLFQEPPAASLPPTTPNYASEEIPKQCMLPAPPISGGLLTPTQSGVRIELDPAQSKTGGTWRNKYMDQDYAFTVRNISTQPKCFYVGLNIKDDDGNPIWEDYDPNFPGGKSPVAPSIYGRQEALLAPGETKSMSLKAPALGGFPLTSYNTTVVVEAFRNLRDQWPVQVSEPISVQQTPWFG